MARRLAFFARRRFSFSVAVFGQRACSRRYPLAPATALRGYPRHARCVDVGTAPRNHTARAPGRQRRPARGGLKLRGAGLACRCAGQTGTWAARVVVGRQTVGRACSRRYPARADNGAARISPAPPLRRRCRHGAPGMRQAGRPGAVTLVSGQPVCSPVNFVWIKVTVAELPRTALDTHRRRMIRGDMPGGKKCPQRAF